MSDLIASLGLSSSSVIPLVANLVVALFLLLAGLLIAKGLGSLTVMVLKSVKLDSGAEQIGLNALLEKGDIKRSVSELLGDLLYWVVSFIIVIGVISMFGLPVGTALAKMFAYMGIVFLAALILGVGIFLANLAAGIVRLVMANFGIESARTASRIIYFIVIIFTFLAALAELGISSEVFIPQIGVIIGAFGLAAAIAFGLGCKDMAADFLHNIFKGK